MAARRMLNRWKEIIRSSPFQAITKTISRAGYRGLFRASRIGLRKVSPTMI